MRITIRHIDPHGIGYNQGYTTLEAFFAFTNGSCYLPFLDVRGHIFNNGKPAANAGFGVRYLGSSRIWGINSYYDYRKTNHLHYNQVSVGLESLGKVWDVRLNGYLPVGTTSTPYGTSTFSHFQGHHLYFSRKQEFAMKGANAEVGAHIDSFKNVPLYFAAGPYYLEGKGRVAWGGEARVAIDLYEYVRIEGNTSYDNVFKWIGQGQLSINIPFGKRKTCKKDPQCSCSHALAMSHRAVQRVDRNEIIPVDHRHHSAAAINPATGEPWFFWFVDNTSSSLGTYESPFSTLVQAQNASSPNQVIYVFPGDGTTKGMSDGIAMQNAQMLLGASISHSFLTTTGTIVVPALAPTIPHITNTSGNAVTLANNNTVSGFHISTEFTNNSDISGGIFGIGITNFAADQNTFDTLIPNTNGIYLQNPSGQVVVSNSSFSNFTDQNAPGNGNGNGIFIEMTSNNTLDLLRLEGSLFNNISFISGAVGGTGILVQGSGTITTLDSSGNTFSNFFSGVGIFNDGATIHTLRSSEDTFSLFDVGSGIANTGMLGTLSVTGDNFNQLLSARAIFNNNSIDVFNFSNNTVYLLTAGSIAVQSFGTIDTVSFSGNSFIDLDSSFGTVNIGSIDTFSSSGNTFSGLNSSNGIQNPGTIYTFTSTGDSFSFLNASNGINSDGSINSLTYSGGSFSGLTESNGILNNDSISQLSVLGNSLTGLIGNSTGILSASSTIVTSIDISNNTFTGVDITADGYAAIIQVDGSTTCLNFTNNSATSNTAFIPYQFQQSNPGVFNRTTESGPSTNIGQFDIGAGVGAEGTCSQ